MIKPAAWLWDASAGEGTPPPGAYLNKTRAKGYAVLEDAADVLYIGYLRRFEAMLSLLSISGVYTDLAIKIWDGSSWVDSNIDYSFGTSDFVRWSLREDTNGWMKLGFSDASPHAATPPDSKERYWLKINAAAVTTPAVVTSLEIAPYVHYTTPELVSSFLQQTTGEEFDLTTKPSETTLEDIIRRRESELDRVTQRSWRLNDSTDVLEFNYAGIKLIHRPVRRLESVKLWQGISWRTLEQGRTGECYPVNDLGMIYCTRFFIPVFIPYSGGGPILPFVFLHMFRYPVEVSYQWGEDFETSSDASYVEHITTLMTSISLLQMAEQAILTKRGVDRVELSAKLRLWEDEVKQGLATLARGFAIW